MKFIKCQSSTYHICLYNDGNLIRTHSSWNGKFEAYPTAHQRNEMKFNWITACEKYREDAFQSRACTQNRAIDCLFAFHVAISNWFKLCYGREREREWVGGRRRRRSRGWAANPSLFVRLTDRPSVRPFHPPPFSGFVVDFDCIICCRCLQQFPFQLH